MQIKLGNYTRIFAWTPIRFLERSPDGDAYIMKTVFLKRLWVLATRANGGGASLVYKSDEVYKREWRESVMSRIETDFTTEEIDAYFNAVGISYLTHQIADAVQAIRTYVAEHGVN